MTAIEIPVQHTEPNGDRTYTYPPTGEQFPSVTTILSRGLPNEFTNVVTRETIKSARANPDESDKWHRDAHRRFLDDRALLGTQVHAYAEAKALGLPAPDFGSDEHEGYQARLEAVDRFFAEVQPRPVRVETVCFNPKSRYAGTFDLDAEIAGLGLVRMDFKTSAAVYEKHRAQCVAYAHATHYLDGGDVLPLPSPDHGAVVLFGEGGNYEFVPVPIDGASFEVFLAAQAVADWRQTKHPELRWTPPARLAEPGDVLEARCKLLQEHGHLDALIAAWPAEVLTFRQARDSGQTHTAAELAAIRDAVRATEAAAPPFAIGDHLAERLGALPADLRAAVDATLGGDVPPVRAEGFTAAHHVLVQRYVEIAEDKAAERRSQLASAMGAARATCDLPPPSVLIGWVTDDDVAIQHLDAIDHELLCALLDGIADTYITVTDEGLVATVEDADELIGRLGGKGAVLDAGRTFARERGLPSPRSSAAVVAEPLMLASAIAKFAA